MRELLIRYLLGELEQNEHEDLQRRLAASPELRRELAHLRTCFVASCQSDEPDEPPRGLAQRTSDRVAGCDGGEGSLMPAFSPDRGVAIGGAADPPAGALGWSLADLTVAGGVVLAVSMLLFPALRDSRDESRRNVCQNNQIQLFRLVTLYADEHGHYFPKVHPNENAGNFTVQLVDKGFISAEELELLLICPGAPLADLIRAGQFAIEIPTSAELRTMSANELAAARRKMSPFYAYRFPYRIGKQIHFIRDERMPLSPLFSDTSGDKRHGLMSPNHGGSIVQVMYQDGSVKALTSCALPGINDDVFLNSMGVVAAGLGRQDAVLGRSEATPGILSLGPAR